MCVLGGGGSMVVQGRYLEKPSCVGRFPKDCDKNSQAHKPSSRVEEYICLRGAHKIINQGIRSGENFSMRENRVYLIQRKTRHRLGGDERKESVGRRNRGQVNGLKGLRVDAVCNPNTKDTEQLGSSIPMISCVT